MAGSKRSTGASTGAFKAARIPGVLLPADATQEQEQEALAEYEARIAAAAIAKHTVEQQDRLSEAKCLLGYAEAVAALSMADCAFDESVHENAMGAVSELLRMAQSKLAGENALVEVSQ